MILTKFICTSDNDVTQDTLCVEYSVKVVQLLQYRNQLVSAKTFLNASLLYFQNLLGMFNVK